VLFGRISRGIPKMEGDWMGWDGGAGKISAPLWGVFQYYFGLCFRFQLAAEQSGVEHCDSKRKAKRMVGLNGVQL